MVLQTTRHKEKLINNVNNLALIQPKHGFNFIRLLFALPLTNFMYYVIK